MGILHSRFNIEDLNYALALYNSFVDLLLEERGGIYSSFTLRKI